MSFDPNAIGNRIFTLRTNAKLSQEKLAEKLGVSHRHLGDLERGSSNGSVKILIDIAEYFHVSMDYLLLGRDPSRDPFQNELQAAIDHLEKIKGLLQSLQQETLLPVLHRQERFLCYSKISARVSSCTSPRSCV